MANTSNGKLSDQVKSGISPNWQELRGRQTFLGSLVQFVVRFEIKVDVDEVSAGKKLENHSRGNDGQYTQLHQGSSIARHHSRLVERIRHL